MSNRGVICAELMERREQQDVQYGGEQHDDAHVLNDWVVLVSRYATDAAPNPVCKHDLDYSPEDLARFRHRMLDAAALAMAAIESLDRRFPNAKHGS